MGDIPDQISLSGLMYFEDGEWMALALEMDLRGYGKTADEAIGDLHDVIRMQLSFARQKNDPDLIFTPAEKKYFDIYKEVRKVALLEIASGTTVSQPRTRFVGDLALPDVLNSNNKCNTSWAHATA